MTKFNVVVYSYGEKDYKELITKSPVSERAAEKIESGLNINLNHTKYYTAIEEAN